MIVIKSSGWMRQLSASKKLSNSYNLTDINVKFLNEKKVLGGIIE